MGVAAGGRALRRLLRFALLAILVFVALWASPLGTTSMQVLVVSDASGKSQMFMSDGSGEADSLSVSAQPLVVGQNTLRFDFSFAKGRLGGYHRWVVCDCPGRFTVQELAMRSPLITRVIPLTRLKEGPGIKSLTVTAEGAQIVTKARASAPQVDFPARTGAFYALNLVLLAGLALAIAALVTVQGILIRHYFNTADSALTSAWHKWTGVLRQAVWADTQSAGGSLRLRLPTIVTVFAAGVVTVNVVMMLIGAVSTGVSTDEPTHVSRMQSWLDTGWYLPRGDLADDAPKEGVPGTYVYGPVMALLGHVSAVAAGAENWGIVARSAEAYAARHVAVALVGVLGLVASAAIGRVLLGSWRWGLLAAATLSAVPMWTGHAMFNIKDTPVATGYTLATLGLIALARPAALEDRKKTLLAIATLTVGIVIAVGTRPGMWTAIVASSVVMLAVSWWVASARVGWGRASLLAVCRAGAMATAGIASFAILLAVYPKAFANPVTLAWESALSSADFERWDGSLVTAGIRHGQPPPWWYAPVWFTHQLPVLLLVFALIGTAFAVIVAMRAVARRHDSTTNTLLVAGLALILMQALLMPLAAIALESRLYDGIRQLLFIIPGWALLASIGMWVCYRHAGVARRQRRIVVVVVGTLTSAALILPTYDQLRLFPYNYAYFNEIATLQPINDRWMTDYWSTSLRELSARIPSRDFPTCRGTDVTRMRDCSTPSTVRPYLVEVDGTGASSLDHLVNFWHVRPNRASRVPENCRAIDWVTRPLRQQSLVMSFLLRCDAAFPEYPLAGVVMSPDSGGEFLLDGWLLPVGEAGVWSVGEQGRVGVTLPEDLRGRDVSIVLAGSRLAPPGETRDLRILVNDEPVADVVLPGGDVAQQIEFVVPARVAESLGGGRILITVQTPDPVVPSEVGLGAETRPLGFLLESLSISAGAPS